MSHTAASRPARGSRAPALLAALALAPLAATPPAHAGEYKVYDCNPPGISVPGASLGEWQFEATPGAATAFNDCAFGGGFGAGGGTGIDAGGYAGWRVQAPANVYIRRLRTWGMGWLGPKYSGTSPAAEFPHMINGACFNGSGSNSPATPPPWTERRS